MNDKGELMSSSKMRKRKKMPKLKVCGDRTEGAASDGELAEEE